MDGLHRRQHTSTLAAAERRVLLAISERLPTVVTSDQLTALALGAMCTGGLACAFAPGRPWAAAAVTAALALNWFGDSLDGTLARVRRAERPRYGYYVDHIVDLAGVTALLTGMGCSGAMHPIAAGAALVGYLLVSAESFLATHVTGVFRVSFAGIGPTELRILLVVAAWRVAAHPATHALTIGGAIGAAGLIAAFAISAVRTARLLSRAEPLPDRSRRVA